jgi:cysteine-rich repeat protein
MSAGETIFAIVDTYVGDKFAPTSGPFTLTVAQKACGNGVVEIGEQCDDGNTDDGDGCSSLCVLQGDDCSDPFIFDEVDEDPDPMIWRHKGSLEGHSARYSGTCANSLRPEVVYEFTAPVAGTYTFHELLPTSSGFDAVLYLWSSCPLDGSAGTQLVCADDGARDQIQYNLLANQTVWLFVDAYGSSNGLPSNPAYEIEVTYSP